MLNIWAEASEREKDRMLATMLETVYCDTNQKRTITLKPRGVFLPLFALCDSLREKEGLIFTHDFVGIGDPDGHLPSSTHLCCYYRYRITDIIFNTLHRLFWTTTMGRN